MYNLTYDCCAEIGRRTKNVIASDGYPLEEYSVTTEDGYINSMFRIPHGKRTLSNNNRIKPPVLLCHGLSCSCAVFVDQGRLGYYLADQGFDVWLPNNRGTTFSRKHKTWDGEKDKDKYWNFSWHEIAVHDLPSFVDFILEETGFEKLFFIGHSQGATVYAAFVAERPEYNEKIALCCMLGPPIIFKHTAGYLLKLFSNVLMPLIEVVHNYLRLPVHEMPFTGLARIMGSFSKPNTILHKFSQFMLFIVAGYANYEQTSNLDFTQFCQTTPNSFSMRQAYHYCQIIRNERFAKYDYGPEENEKLYGLKDPPLYNLTNLTAPIALFYSKNDMYNSSKDMDKLEQIIGNVVHRYEVESEAFNHVDFLMGKDSISLLYCHISEIMKKYTKYV